MARRAKARTRGLVLLPDNGRDSQYPVEMGLDGFQAGAVRIFFTVPDPENPGERISDYTGVLRPGELDSIRPFKGSGGRGRYLYEGEVCDEEA